ncbi:IS1634 family transposase [Limibacterium fermenti]|uniref:IS1634 family transposase n=1 Tax=Limibacterium fermenti TaxID=3229863 RepID=UPI003A75672E
MFIRKRKNKSGTTSVVVVDKSGGKFKELVTIGVSENPFEIARLCQKGKAWIKSHTCSPELDLFEEREQTERLLNNIEQLLINGTELLLGNIFDRIGFNSIDDPVFRHLVLSRLSFPSSKRATVEYLKDYYDEDIDLSNIYRYMDKLYNTHKGEVQRISTDHTKHILGGVIGIVFYDVTTIYFETDHGDDLRKTGFSKEGKHQNPQIVLGLLVSLGGYPLTYEIFEGNKFEGHTMLKVVKDFTGKHDISDAIVVADSGLMTHANIEALQEGGYQYIIGGKIKNESNRVKDWVLSLNLEDREFSEYSKAEGVRLIVGYSQKRADKDKYNREKGIRRLEKLHRSKKLTKSSINKRGYNKYLKMEGEVRVSIDYELFEQDSRWDGLKGYITNTRLPAKEVYANYSHLWMIENAFRIAKSKLEIRPIFHFTSRRIEAHICICFAAYKVYKELERLLYEMGSDVTPDKAIYIAGTITTIVIKLPNTNETIKRVLLLTDKQKKLAKLFEDAF